MSTRARNILIGLSLALVLPAAAAATPAPVQAAPARSLEVRPAAVLRRQPHPAQSLIALHAPPARDLRLIPAGAEPGSAPPPARLLAPGLRF